MEKFYLKFKWNTFFVYFISLIQDSETKFTFYGSENKND